MISRNSSRNCARRSPKKIDLMSAVASAGVDARWMRLALVLGRRGLGRVWPNPAVGCVIVKDNRVLGRGWTKDGGRPHAETIALAQAGAAARGATVYVTLEPCAHTGKTPPCATALIDAGVSRIVVALQDPDPRVAGRGLKMLRKAGIEVNVGTLEAEARADQIGFLSRVTNGRPMVTLKLAMSVDGKIALGNGQSKWITGSQARRAVHAMRASHDAVMVGAGTTRADAPSLTVRGLGVDRQPVRLVVSSRLDLPVNGPLFETCEEAPVWLICGASASAEAQSAWRDAGAEVLSTEADQVQIEAALRLLADAGLTRVFCEGGGQLAASLLRADLVDRLVVFTAGVALGADGLPGLGALGLTELDSAARFKLNEQRRIGDDLLTEWRRPRRGNSRDTTPQRP